MSGISSVGSSMSAAAYNPLDKNGDGVVDAQELQEAAQSGLLSASIVEDEDDSDPSAADKFSGNLASMLLQMQQTSANQSGTSSGDSADDQSPSPVDALFASLDTNHDGTVSSGEFVVGRPKDMSEEDASSLFKSLDAQNSGALDKDQFAEGLDVLSPYDQSAADMKSLETSANGDDGGASDGDTSSQNALELFISEMQASLNAYQNTYGQYDADASDGVAA